jgi:hypothetical protein
MLNMHVNPPFNTLEHKLIRYANYTRIINLINVEAANNPTMQATKLLNFNKNFLVTNLDNN